MGVETAKNNRQLDIKSPLPPFNKGGVGRIYLGIDVGSVSVKTALFDPSGRLNSTTYRRHHGEPLRAALNVLSELTSGKDCGELCLGITGSAARILSDLIGGTVFNEVLSHARGGIWACRGARSIIDIGGNDSKLILLGSRTRAQVEDFAMNDLCAAGTGSFLDQQASRLKIRIEEEWGDLAIKSQSPPRIAGRCTVFAKSDMIHLQQRGTPVHDIVSGLCFAVARNFKSVIAKGKDIQVPVSFQGGVAANKGMVRAFTEVFDFTNGGLVVSDHHAVAGAIGAALLVMEEGNPHAGFMGLDRLDAHLHNPPSRGSGHAPLSLMTQAPHPAYTRPHISPGVRIPAYLGIDVGSTSTKVLAMAESGEILSFRYLWTSGRPIEAVKTGLRGVGEEVGDRIEIRGVGTTGSGRYLIGDFVGADIVKNEITAQSRAALVFDPGVDTLFEIGGQDSKYVSLSDGVVVDFEMNKVCAAGTGSFLQEQAERLGMDIEKDFGPAAMKAGCPTRMGERCTVFIESDLVHNQQAGAPREDLAAGLALSIVNNYLNKVVGKKLVGERIVFQGAVAFNQAVVSAFEAILGKKIVVPTHPHITGAIGAAILAREHVAQTGKATAFQGFDIGARQYETTTFECRACSNVCEVSRVSIEKRPPLFYGARCDIFEVDRKAKKEDTPDLFMERESLLMKDYVSAGDGEKGTIGIPRALSFFYEFFPFWKAFFSSVGFRLIPSDVSHKDLIHRGCEQVTAETCFPVKIAHGHVMGLMEKNAGPEHGRRVDYIFVPSIIGLPDRGRKYSQHYSCPYIQSIPYLLLSALDSEELGKKLLFPAIHFNRGRGAVRKTLAEMGKRLGFTRREADRALRNAFKAQEEFTRLRRKRGREILRGLSPEGDHPPKAVALLGRPYNTCDGGANMDLPKKLRDLGVTAIPMDFLPYEETDASDEHPNMFWAYGQKILEAAGYVRGIQGLYPVYLTNFACGPDSFVLHYFKDIMRDKPSLILEVDEHSADAGLVTRCEAFLDSIRRSDVPQRKRSPVSVQTLEEGRTLYIPYMMDAALALTACLRHHGIRAEVLPPSDDRSLELGRRFCSGKECLPCIVTTGDILKLIKDTGCRPASTAIFMPTSDGPCRFGQYSRLQRMVLDELGYGDIPIISPTSENGYSEVGNLGVSFQRLAWQGIVAVDLLEKCARQTRPYEVNTGETDALYEKLIGDLFRTLERGEGPLRVLMQARREFSRIRIRPEPRPVIGIVGEIFLRLHRFSNRDVARKIEALGGEAWVAPMGEWILYTGYLYKKNSQRRRRVDMILMSMLRQKTQLRTEHRLSAPFAGFLKNLHETRTEVLLSFAAPYLRDSFGGESILTIGKAIDYIRRGASGIINTLPFTCMPGNTVRGLSKKIREDLDGVPWINMVYDGMEIPNERTRFEAFLHQARSWRQSAGEMTASASA